MLSGHSLADASGRIIAFDPQVCEIIQRSAREVVGLTYDALTHPDDRSRNRDIVRALAAADGPTTFEKRYMRPDGSAVWAKVQVSRLGELDEGHLIGTITMIDKAADIRDPQTQWHLAKLALGSIRDRRRELGEDLFADYPFAILLELYLAEAEGRPIDLAELSRRVAMPLPIVMRWLSALQAEGLVERAEWAKLRLQLTLIATVKIERTLCHKAAP